MAKCAHTDVLWGSSVCKCCWFRIFTESMAMQWTCYPPVIKHGTESPPFSSAILPFKPPLSSGISQPCLMTLEVGYHLRLLWQVGSSQEAWPSVDSAWIKVRERQWHGDLEVLNHYDGYTMQTNHRWMPWHQEERNDENQLQTIKNHPFYWDFSP